MLLFEFLFLQLESLTCYLMPIRTEQLHFCICSTWKREQSRLFGFILFFIISSWGGAGLGGSYMCCPAGELDLLAQGGLWAREVSRVPGCSSSAATSLTITVRLGRDTTALQNDGWHVSCHRRRSRGSVTVACLFPASRVQGGVWGRALGWGCCSGCPWAACLLFSGSSSVSYLWQAHSDLACFLFAGWFFTHLVSRKELA